MKKIFSLFKNQLIIMAAFLIAFASIGLAQKAVKVQKLTPIDKSRLRKLRKPCDLVVKSITLAADCQVTVVIKNQGLGGVANAAYRNPPHPGVTIQAYSGNTGFGGYNLNGFDRERVLKTPGGEVTFTGFKRALNPQEVLPIRIKIINPNNIARESNLKNNSKSVRLKCRQKQCDLIVDKIELDQNCRIKVTIKNQGGAGVCDAAYASPPNNYVIIQASSGNTGWGGYNLDGFDRQRLLKNPGGQVVFTGFKRALNSGEYLTLKIEIINPNNIGCESNLNNNVKFARLYCRKL